MNIQQQKSYKILLVGDSCLDIYHYGNCDRLSPEAPIPVLKETRVKKIGGMSLNVKNNLETFGLKVTHVTNKKLIEKHRLIDIKSNYQIARLDTNENNELEELDIDAINSSEYDCLVISDYCKGSIGEKNSSKLCNLFSRKPIFIDSKRTDMSCFSNAYIKINDKEEKDLKHKGVNLDYVITLGSRGAKYREKIYKTNNVEVFDVCGAGDVFLSSLVYAFLVTENIERSIVYANKLASRSVTKNGTYVLSKEDLNDFRV